MTSSAAFVANGRMDVLAANPPARALYPPVFDEPRRPANIARSQFLDPRAREYHTDWGAAANVTVALLRTEAGRDPNDRDLRELVGELSTVSEEFRTRWAAHDVRIHHNGAKQFHHPTVGTLELVYHSLDLPTQDHGKLLLTIYTAEPGSPSEDALKLLASWGRPPDSTSPGPRPPGCDHVPGPQGRAASGEWERLTSAGSPPETFDVSMVAGRPEPARRCLTHSIGDTPVALGRPHHAREDPARRVAALHGDPVVAGRRRGPPAATHTGPCRLADRPTGGERRVPRRGRRAAARCRRAALGGSRWRPLRAVPLRSRRDGGGDLRRRDHRLGPPGRLAGGHRRQQEGGFLRAEITDATFG